MSEHRITETAHGFACSCGQSMAMTWHLFPVACPVAAEEGLPTLNGLSEDGDEPGAGRTPLNTPSPAELAAARDAGCWECNADVDALGAEPPSLGSRVTCAGCGAIYAAAQGIDGHIEWEMAEDDERSEAV